MENIKVGFSRKIINPEKGIGMSGYYVTRLCEGIHDDIECNTVVFSGKEKTAVIAVLDLCEIETGTCDLIRKKVAEKLSTVPEAVMVSATHTHTGPFAGYVMGDAPKEPTDRYTEFLIETIIASAEEAYADIKDSRIGYKIGKAEGIAFSRRFLMKDGSIATNPGLHNPDIVNIIGEPDIALPVVRIDREDGDTIVIANYGCHPDTFGGNLISADWPGVFRRTFESRNKGTKAVFINGAEGEINHINVFATEDDMHGMTIGFDDIPRGFGHTEFMGNTVADAVAEVYDKIEYIDSSDIRFGLKTVKIPTNRATEEELVEAHKIHELHVSGHDSEIPYTGMFLTTVVAEAERMVELEFGPEYIETYVSAVSVGGIAFVGIAGEPFSAIGLGLKAADGWDTVIPCSLTDGYAGYFPNKEAYDEGGYEARSSTFAPGVAEILISEGCSLLDELKKD